MCTRFFFSGPENPQNGFGQPTVENNSMMYCGIMKVVDNIYSVTLPVLVLITLYTLSLLFPTSIL